MVIGGGHNGLVAAAYLARAGRRVALVERRPELGGASFTARSPDGLPLEVGAQDVSLLRPQIVGELRLQLPLHRPAVSLLSLLSDREALPLWRDPQRTGAALSRLSAADASAYPRFAEQTRRQAALLAQMLDRTPPNLPAASLWKTARAVWPWWPVAVGLRGMGPRAMMEFIRTLPMEAARLLEEWFEREELRGVLAAGAIVGLMQGPRSPGTALMLLYQSIGGFPRGATFVRGGVGGLIGELARAAAAFGVELHTGDGVERILTDDYAAVGVRLASGAELRARTVAASTDPRQTLFELVGAPELELRVVRRVRNIRFRGSTARVNLVTDGLPDFKGVVKHEHMRGHVVISPSLDYLERAFDQAKYGQISADPHLSLTIPTLHDESADPSGPQVLSVTVRYAPYQLRDSSWESQREVLADRVVSRLADYAPDLSQRITNRQVLTPMDLEREYGLPEGSIHHGQMALDQLLFMRPIPGFAGYRSPVDRLYFCGAGAHPGGGLTGAAGRNAAQVILKDLSKGLGV